MDKLKNLAKSNYFFPALALCYGLFYILFGENYPFKAGYSTDGRVFESIVFSFNESYYFDSYYVHRILPSAIIKLLFSISNQEMTESGILLMFKLINVFSLTVSLIFIRKIFLLLKVTEKNQILFSVLFLFNFGVIKYHFYFPSMTDQMAMMLSTLLLYFYLRNNTPGIIVSTITLAFTWPMAYYLGLILIALPVGVLPYSPLENNKTKVVQGLSALYSLFLLILFVFIQQTDINVPFVAHIDRRPLFLFTGILSTVIIYYFFSKLFLNKTLWDVPLFFKRLNYIRILLSIASFISVYLIIKFLNPKPTYTYSIQQTLTDPILYTLIKPLITIVADISYFGIIICILILFWSSFSKTVSQMGWGLVLAFGFNLLLFGTAPQSRHLINLLPWITVFLAKAIDKYSFSKQFYAVSILLSLLASKIWLKLNIYDLFNEWAATDKNGNLGFPDQILWMNIGPWMNEQMYYIQGFVALIFFVILFFTLYHIEKKADGKLKLSKKYTLR